jgi:tetratricopeptide (TPR) repeat protein
MASQPDVYSPCPCGSGKKIKFCCGAVLGQLDKVARLHEAGQPDQALKSLDRLAEKNPDAPIVEITRAQLLMENSRFDEAARCMRTFLKDNPDSGHGTGLLAFARFMDVGFHEAKPEIHRAFQMCAQTSPDVVASLAAQIADEVFRQSSLSAREHLALALRLTGDSEERDLLIRELMKIDGAAEIPYPMRGSHSLAPVADVPEESQKDLRSAVRLSMLGCWEIAAKLFHKLTEVNPDDWGLWKNIGLCRAWDTDHSSAADALHQAAELAPEYEQAVECETLAQLLELPEIEDQCEVIAARYKLKSTSHALSLLDGVDRLERLHDLPEQNDARPQIVARYLALEFPHPGDSEPVAEDTVPKVQAEVSIFELQVEEGGSQGVLSVIAPESQERSLVMDLIEETLADHIEPLKTDDEDETDPVLYSEHAVRTVLMELMPSQERKYFGKRIDINQRREHAAKDAHEFVQETWCNRPLRRLGGKSPREAMEDPELSVDLAAAVHVLEAVSDVAVLYVDMRTVRESLKIAPEKPLEVDDDTVLNSVTIMQSHRLPLKELTTFQLNHIVKRALMIRHVPFACAVLNEVANRDLDELTAMTRDQFLVSIAQVCREMGRREDALRWIAQGRSEADADNFEDQLNWTMREFQFRIEDRNDQELPGLVDRLWNFYGEKLPAIRESIEPVLKELSIPIPGESASGLVLPGDSSPAPAVVASASSGGESKLWLPGQ